MRTLFAILAALFVIMLIIQIVADIKPEGWCYKFYNTKHIGQMFWCVGGAAELILNLICHNTFWSIFWSVYVVIALLYFYMNRYNDK